MFAGSASTTFCFYTDGEKMALSIAILFYWPRIPSIAPGLM